MGLGLASALKHTYTLQYNPTAGTWLSTRAVYRCSTPKACTTPSRGAQVMSTYVIARSCLVRARSRYAIAPHPVLNIVTNYCLCTDTMPLKAFGHDISKRFVTKFKRIVRGPNFR